MERIIANLMYASRWLLAPICFGLSLALLAIGIKFFQDVLHILPAVFEMAEAEGLPPLSSPSRRFIC